VPARPKRIHESLKTARVDGLSVLLAALAVPAAFTPVGWAASASFVVCAFLMALAAGRVESGMPGGRTYKCLTWLLALTAAGAGLWLARALEETWPEAAALAAAAGAALVPAGLPVFVASGMEAYRAVAACLGAAVARPGALPALALAQVLVVEADGLLLRQGLEVSAVAAPLEAVETQRLSREPSFLMLMMAVIFCARDRRFLDADASDADPPDPFEPPLCALGRGFGFEEARLLPQFPRVATRRAWVRGLGRRGRQMCVSSHGDHGLVRVFLRGPVQDVLGRCTRIFDGHEREMREEERARILETAGQMRRGAGWVLAFATTTVPEAGAEEPLEGLAFVGMVALARPLRENAREILQRLQALGVTPVLASGASAEATARLAGLFQQGHAHIDLTPEQKAEVVRFWQEKGYLVAALGVGPGDAGMLRASDAALWAGWRAARVRVDVRIPLAKLEAMPALFEGAFEEMAARRRALLRMCWLQAGCLALAAGAWVIFPNSVWTFAVPWLHVLAGLWMARRRNLRAKPAKTPKRRR
jgi:hypothetical protein